MFWVKLRQVFIKTKARFAILLFIKVLQEQWSCYIKGAYFGARRAFLQVDIPL
ncbi:hypothetical protein PG593_08850 [Riemerella anatipestifer]|nr:hypothetical protein [Riemerella anatipestifer]MDY3529882.1 hypothetical protein [Riemerella anatipestifer]